jgi:hypothetical protein
MRSKNLLQSIMESTVSSFQSTKYSILIAGMKLQRNATLSMSDADVWMWPISLAMENNLQEFVMSLGIHQESYILNLLP